MRAFEHISSKLPAELSALLDGFSDGIKSECTEIHIKAGYPIYVFCAEKICISSGRVVAQNEPEQAVLSLCEFSIANREKSLENGFISLEGGHRAGVCGTKTAGGIANISALTIRVAREFVGCSRPIFERAGLDPFRCSILVCGAPASGKTTLLRDYIKTVAAADRQSKIAVIDERGELTATSAGTARFEPGMTVDVLDGYSKSEGFAQALRCLSPALIACDELYSREDFELANDAAGRGVRVAASTHTGELRDFLRSDRFAEIRRDGVFTTLVYLKNQKIERIARIMEL